MLRLDAHSPTVLHHTVVNSRPLTRHHGPNGCCCDEDHRALRVHRLGTFACIPALPAQAHATRDFLTAELFRTTVVNALFHPIFLVLRISCAAIDAGCSAFLVTTFPCRPQSD